MSAGIFKVFIALHATDYASRHLSHFANIASQAGKGVDSINKKLMLMGGLATMMVGGAVVGAMVKLTEHSVKASTELDNVERKLKSIGGINLGVFKQVSKQGWDLGNKFPASTQAERLQIFGDLHTVFGDVKTARETWKAGLQFKQNMQSINPHGGEADFFAAFKAAELSTAGKHGHIASPKAFMDRLELFSNVYAGSMGRVSPSDLYAFMKQAKYSRFDLTNGAMYKAAAMMYEMGGSQTGTAYQALARVAGGRLGNASSGATYAREWERMGLITNITERSKQGNPKKFDVVGRGLLYSDPNQWAEKIFLPAMEAKGYSLNKKDAFLSQLVRMFGNQSAGQAVYTMIQQRGVIHKDAEIFAKSKAQPWDKDYAGVFAGFGKSFEDLFAVIGKNLKPVIIPVVAALTQMVRGFTAWLNLHPKFTQLFVIGGLLGGVLITVGGAVATLVGLCGTGVLWVIGGMTLAVTWLVSAFTALVTVVETVRNIINLVSTAFSNLGPSLQSGLNSILAGLHLPQIATATPSVSTNNNKSIVVTQNFHGMDKNSSFAKVMADNLHAAIINPNSAFSTTSTHHNKQAYGHGY